MTKEIKHQFREFVKFCLEKGFLAAHKTAYKSNKIYLTVKSITLKIRSYAKKIITKKEFWEPLYKEMKELYAKRAPFTQRALLYDRIKVCD